MLLKSQSVTKDGLSEEEASSEDILDQSCRCGEVILSQGQDAAAWGQIQGFAHPWMLTCKDNPTGELPSGKPSSPLEIMLSQSHQ